MLCCGRAVNTISLFNWILNYNAKCCPCRRPTFRDWHWFLGCHAEKPDRLSHCGSFLEGFRANPQRESFTDSSSLCRERFTRGRSAGKDFSNFWNWSNIPSGFWNSLLARLQSGKHFGRVHPADQSTVVGAFMPKIGKIDFVSFSKNFVKKV